MALINCPNCGEQISDKAKTCIHCGYVFPDKEDKEPDAVLVCPECGAELEKGTSVCPKCGYPIKEEDEKKEPEEENHNPQAVEVTGVKNGRKILIGAIVLIAVIAIGAFAYFQVQNQNQKAAVAEYEENFSTITYSMLDGAAKAETAGNLIYKVWRNCIYEEADSETDKFTVEKYASGKNFYYDDFNTALSNLFNDKDFTSDILDIKTNQEYVMDLMKDMTNPPEEWEEAYGVLSDYYEAYLDLTNLVISPTGSLTTFSSNFNDADSAVSTQYSKVKMYLE